MDNDNMVKDEPIIPDLPDLKLICIYIMHTITHIFMQYIQVMQQTFCIFIIGSNGIINYMIIKQVLVLMFSYILDRNNFNFNVNNIL